MNDNDTISMFTQKHAGSHMVRKSKFILCALTQLLEHFQLLGLKSILKMTFQVKQKNTYGVMFSISPKCT